MTARCFATLAAATIALAAARVDAACQTGRAAEIPDAENLPAVRNVQELQDDAETMPAAYARLLEALTPDPERGAAPDRSRRTALLEAFLARHGSRHATAPEVLRARCRLGSLHLLGLRPVEAIDVFDAVVDAAGTDAALIDVRGHAQYGKAQAEELLGRRAVARRLLDEIADRFAGTRYADLARAATARLEADGGARVGQRAPRIEPRLDIAGKARSIEALRGQPALVVFFAPDDEDGVAQVRRFTDAAARAGLASAQMLLFALDDDVDRLAKNTQRLGFRMPIVAAPSRFLDDAVLRYRVTSVPAGFLIAAEGTLIARDLPPDRLVEVLRKLSRRNR